MAITQSQIADLVTATLFSDHKKKVSNIDPNLLRGYVAGRRLVRKNNVVEQTGRGIRWNVNVTGDSSAAWIGYYHIDTYNTSDHLKQATMTMKMLTNNFSFDEQEESFNGPPLQIVDMIKNREMQSMIGQMQAIETAFWSTPSSTDTLTPHGMLYWFPYCATEGFVGTYPSGYTDIAGLDPTTYTGWKSYGATYAAVSQDDLILKMRTAATLTRFEPPLDSMPIGNYNTGDMYGYYMNYTTLQQFENELRNQNDNLGPDVASFDGRAQFRRTPLTDVPQLASNTRNPIFGINWGQVKNYNQRGWWMKRKQVQAPNQALVVAVNNYCSMEIVVHDRRTGGFNLALAA